MVPGTVHVQLASDSTIRCPISLYIPPHVAKRDTARQWLHFLGKVRYQFAQRIDQSPSSSLIITSALTIINNAGDALHTMNDLQHGELLTVHCGGALIETTFTTLICDLRLWFYVPELAGLDFYGIVTDSDLLARGVRVGTRLRILHQLGCRACRHYSCRTCYGGYDNGSGED